MRDPLLAPLSALAGGILLSRFVPFEKGELLAAGVAFTVLAAISARRRLRTLALTCWLLASAGVGALLGTFGRPQRPPVIDAAYDETVLAAGCVVSTPILEGDRQQFLLELEPGARARVNLYLRPGEAHPNLRYGERIELEARLRRPHNFGNPGAFDYMGYLARQGVYWSAAARGASSVTRLEGACGSRFWSVIYTLRAAIVRRIEELYQGDSWTSAMMQAILVGESSKLEKAWTEYFRRTGTYHALVISGLHVAVLAGCLLWLLRILAAPGARALPATAAMGGLYAFVAGGRAPVIRAAGGFTLYLLARYFYRRTRILNLLAAVAFVFLIADPYQVFQASFQLSFLSVAAIGALAAPLLEATSAPLARGLHALSDAGRDPGLPASLAMFRVEMRLLAQTAALWSRLPERLWLLALAAVVRAFLYVYDLAVISAAVQTGLALPMILYFHRLSVTGWFANTIIVPSVSLAVPFGFLAVFTNWTWAAGLARHLLAWAEAAVRWCADIEPHWRVPDPPLPLALGFVAVLLATPWAFRRGGKLRLVALFSALVLLALMLWHPFGPKIAPGRLEVTAIDVGEGDSLLIATPAGKLVLVDAGGIVRYAAGQRQRLDIGEEVVSPYLWSRSIRRLDAVAFSHTDEDHIGGMAAVIRNFRPRQLWAGAGQGPDWALLRHEALRQGSRVLRLETGESFNFGGARFEVLSAGGPNHNNDSLVVRVSYHHHAFLLTGDAERGLENELLAQPSGLRADVLKVAHHGSKTSTQEAFLDAVRPAFALISVGLANPFHHPHPEVLQRVARRSIMCLRTDTLGCVSIYTDGARFRVQTFRDTTHGALAWRQDPF